MEGKLYKQRGPQFPTEVVKTIVQFTPAWPVAQVEPQLKEADDRFTAPPIPKHEGQVAVIGSELLRTDTDTHAAGLVTVKPVTETTTAALPRMGEEVVIMS